MFPPMILLNEAYIESIDKPNNKTYNTLIINVLITFCAFLERTTSEGVYVNFSTNEVRTQYEFARYV